MKRKLELETEDQYQYPQSASKSSKRILHSAILNMKTFPHAKGTSYKIDCIYLWNEVNTSKWLECNLGFQTSNFMSRKWNFVSVT